MRVNILCCLYYSWLAPLEIVCESIDEIHWRKYLEKRLRLMASTFLGDFPLLIYMTMDGL